MATPHVTGIIAYAMANATLAAHPALMKAWLRHTALPLRDGTLMANNGVHAGAGEGVVGLRKTPAKKALHGRSTRDVDADTAVPVWRRAAREDAGRALRGVEQEMACRREAQLSGDTAFLTGTWLCDSRLLRRRSWEGLRGLLARTRSRG